MQQKFLTYQGGLLIILTTLCFASMDAQVKYFSNQISFLIFLWAKYLGQFIFLSVFFFKSRKTLLHYGNLKIQLLRGFCSVAPTLCFFYAIKFVPLAEASALVFFHPLIVVILSAFLLKEHITKRQIYLVLFGLIGVLIIIRPGLGVIHPASFLVVLAGTFFAVYQISTKYLIRISNSTSTLFFTTIFSLFISSVLLIFLQSYDSIHYSMLLIFFGLLSAIGEYCLIRAYKSETASFLTPLFYSQLIWGIMYGFILFNQLPDAFSILGMVILVSVGLLNFYYKK